MARDLPVFLLARPIGVEGRPARLRGAGVVVYPDGLKALVPGEGEVDGEVCLMGEDEVERMVGADPRLEIADGRVSGAGRAIYIGVKREHLP